MKAKTKKFDYFETLINMSNYALEEARMLKTFLQNFNPDELKATKEKMHELEHACDTEKHALTTALVKDFLPPIERDDLFRLSHVTDDLTDSIDSVTSFLYVADIKQLRPDSLEFADLIITACENTVKLLTEFKNFKKSDKIKDYIILLNDVEEKGDALYATAVRALSTSSASTREIIEWRDVYKNFEDCLDSAESVADNIEAIVLKNS